mgnify:CR=1 FL=1
MRPRLSARIQAGEVFEALSHAGYRGDAVTFEVTGEVKRSASAGFILPGDTEPWLSLPEPAPPDGPARLKVRILPDGKVELLDGL